MIVTKKYIEMIEDKLNNRPRKALNWQTPNEVFMVINLVERWWFKVGIYIILILGNCTLELRVGYSSLNYHLGK